MAGGTAAKPYGVKMRTNTSLQALVSPGTKLLASELKDTKRPFAEIAAIWLSPLPWTPLDPLLTRPVAFAFAIEMAVIALMIQMPNGYFWTSRGAEFAVMLFVVCLAFLFGGGGRYSLDRKLGREF